MRLSGKIGEAPASPAWALLSWGLLPRGLTLAASSAPPPWMVFYFFIFFPSSYHDRSVNSSHCSIPAVLSLFFKRFIYLFMIEREREREREAETQAEGEAGSMQGA